MGDLSLMYFFQLAWKRLWALLLSMVLFATGAYCYCKFLAVPKYKASAAILVTNGAIVTQYETVPNNAESISGTDISASLSLANTIVDILETPDIYVELSETLDGKYSYNQLKSFISVSRRATNTLFIDISATSASGEEAKLLANKFAEASCDYVTKYIPYAKASVASTALSNSLVFPRTTYLTSIAALIGIVFAYIAVFIADSLNQSIRGEEEFIARYKIPLLGSVPDFENDEIAGKYYKKSRYHFKKKLNQLSYANNEYDDNKAASDKPTKSAPFAVVEAYKSIRSNLMFLLDKNETGNVIAITSSNASEGKSTTAVNLAVAFSQLEDKILVIDADMRRSSVHKKLKLKNEKGLSNVLAGLEEFENAVEKISDNFHVLTAGPTPPNPSEMLSSRRFAKLIKYARENYDYVLIDTPPINVVSDAIMLAPHTDGTVLILRDGYTPNYTLKRAISTLEFTENKILGAIMNGANPKSGGKYVYRRYSYKSKYYYSQYYNRYGGGRYGRYGGGYGSYSGYGGYDSYGGYDQSEPSNKQDKK